MMNNTAVAINKTYQTNVNDKFVIFSNPEFSDVRTLFVENVLWFVAADICKALDLSNTTMAMQKVDQEDRAKLNLGQPYGEVNCVNEPGVYSLVLTSKKKEAKAFKRWIVHDVIPSIRNNGEYSVVNKTTDLPLSREEMAMYITALQATSDEIKNSCLETMNVLKESLNKQHEEFMSILNSFHDSSEKFFSSFNSINTVTTSNKSNDDDIFINEAKTCIEKICARLNVSVQAAYKLVYTNMSEIDGINVYRNKKESSAIKYVAKNEDYRKSFMKCAESLYNLPTFSNEKINTVSKFEDWKVYQKIPAEICDLVEEYKKKKNKNSHDYARACLFKDFAKAIGINQKQLREKTVEYAKSIGIESCGIGYMIFNNKDMFEILKKIVAEA